MSVSSMTGFAHLQIKTLLGPLSIDVKSVNSRFQDITTRLLDELRFLEADIRTILSRSVARGKIECRMQWVGEVVLEQILNRKALENLYSLQNEVIQFHPEIKSLTL